MKKTIAIVAAIIATMTLTACEHEKDTAQGSGQKQTEQAFKQQREAVPYPADKLRDSLERRNIRERLLRTNNPKKIGYVYLLNFGKVFGYYTIKGKVSNTNSQMTTDQLLVSKHQAPAVVTAPGDDGSYGENEPGIFFFTTEGTFVTTSLDYLYSDQTLPFDVPDLNKKK